MNEQAWIVAPKRADGSAPSITKAVSPSDCDTGAQALLFHSRGDANVRLENTYPSESYAVYEVRVVVVEPPKPPRNTCNMHSDCAAADARMNAKGERLSADHCHDSCCEDCFGS